MPGVKGRSGRETELTPAIAKRICELVQVGLPEGRAAQACGFSGPAVSGWKRRGERDIEAGVDSIFAKFVRALVQADLAFEQVRLSVVVRAAQSPKTWQASKWLLESKYPWWRRNVTVSHDNAPPEPPRRLTREEKQARARAAKRVLDALADG